MEKSLEAAGLWDEVKDRLDQPALGLSGGQQQRLCIARCLAVEPEVLLMDEPCSALDPIATARVEDLIQELKKKYTIIIVTHNLQQAARISDYHGLLSPRAPGRVRADRGSHDRPRGKGDRGLSDRAFWLKRIVSSRPQ